MFFDNSECKSSPCHEWLAAHELRAGDVLIGHDGQMAVVEGVRDSKLWEPVYNLRVAEWHTYFVGGDAWSVWAHNAGGNYGSKNKQSESDEYKPHTIELENPNNKNEKQTLLLGWKKTTVLGSEASLSPMHKDVIHLTIDWLKRETGRNVQVGSFEQAQNLALQLAKGIKAQRRYSGSTGTNPTYEVHPSDKFINLPHIKYFLQGGLAGGVQGHIYYGRPPII